MTPVMAHFIESTAILQVNASIDCNNKSIAHLKTQNCTSFIDVHKS